MEVSTADLAHQQDGPLWVALFERHRDKPTSSKQNDSLWGSQKENNWEGKNKGNTTVCHVYVSSEEADGQKLESANSAA